MAIFTPSDDIKRKEQEKLDLMEQQKNYGTYSESDYVQGLRNQALAQQNALDNYGDFQFSKQDMYDRLENSLLNRKAFTYDVDGDALYQMYKDKYIKGGKLAMQDTMGQAAALTGGYGNSYAATAGNQAYQAYLGQLNDVIPELYQLALQRYQLEGDQIKDNLSLLSADRSTEYGEYADKYGRLSDAYNRAYGFYGDERGREQSSFEEGYSRLSDALTNATNEYNTAYNQAYTDFRNNIADQQAAAQLAASYARSSSSGGSTSNNALVKGIAAAKKEGNDALYKFLDDVIPAYGEEAVIEAMTENAVPTSFYNEYDSEIVNKKPKDAYNEVVAAISNKNLTPRQQNNIIQEALNKYKNLNPSVYGYLIEHL